MSVNKHYIQGMEKQQQGDYKRAVELLTKAISAEPKNPEIYSDRGVAYFHLNDKKAALKDMNKSLELEPDYSYRYSSRAFIRDSMGDTQGAVDDYRKAVELDPEDTIAYNNLGLLEEKLGYMGNAKKNFEKADGLAEKKGWNDAYTNNEKENPELGGATSEAASKEGVEIKPRNIQKEINAEQKAVKEKRTSGIMLDVFRSKKTFKEFVKFVRNGFKQRD
jgi:Flp pilus assembly protein TadD